MLMRNWNHTYTSIRSIFKAKYKCENDKIFHTIRSVYRKNKPRLTNNLYKMSDSGANNKAYGNSLILL